MADSVRQGAPSRVDDVSRVWMNVSEFNYSFIDYVWHGQERRAEVPPKCGIRLPRETERITGTGRDMRISVTAGHGTVT